MNRFAVVADIHGNICALEAFLDDIKRRKITEVVNLGDNVSGPLWPKETMEVLKGNSWVNLNGDHDQRIVSQTPEQLGLSDRFARERLSFDDLKWLEQQQSFTRIGDGISAFHGSPGDEKQYLLETIGNNRIHLSSREEIVARVGDQRTPLMLCGHSHTPRCVRLDDETTIINPGSLGLQAYVEEGADGHMVETGSPHARYAVIDLEEGKWALEFIALKYDWDKAARQAGKQNRPDWEKALSSGYLS
ncbi:MAG: hypothetical protein A2509_01880 [Candidatus Edwardsbacteria bacterium RIFOXYD12_FULL_50_11]|nr:MAG: hypothetical protein A2502_09610 [Candidatus Edwardsbacteria bacterium RifOxyC12_full_54_24]OGF06897.1 MAG: hypothetical protein A2273_01450 [Candidatus Edwardsbacteria bacterium RifOxyA12_full_54_48]OGF10847.1 MAG: hypothetical protein A3K15_06820 [Candidatus Edwardsbacteria bacterium GWE2_54_12]OGF14709.1 MAG: hypothetical protein A2509_01880 [Candidatus Edwardsbacteria bacterium RIFOXYD12_FULL_50_11]OGJ18584.1 MAG: hypothetical protein A2349_06035 [Candidatus Edwardsbacteria bacteriu